MKLNVLLVSDQVRGIDGTGGLGDVATGLAKGLGRRDDIDIRLLMPGYQQISEKGLNDRFENVVVDHLEVPLGDQVVTLKVCRITLPVFSPNEPTITCYLLVQPEVFSKRYNSSSQSVLLARGTLAFLQRYTEFSPDLIHCNDWHTALIPVYLNSLYRNDAYLGRIATLYTTHNNTGGAYQGVKSLDEVRQLSGLPPECFAPGSSKSLEFWGQANHAKGGISFADVINTVSLSYANELRSRAFGGGLEGLLQERANDVTGIVNGIDLDEWNPAQDKFLPAPCRFQPTEPVSNVLAKKKLLREELRNWTAPDQSRPYAQIEDDTVLIGVITRISDQKMPILLPLQDDTGLPHELESPIERLCLHSLAQGPAATRVQWVILGNADPSDTKGQRYVARLEDLQRRYPGQIAFFNGFHIGLSHLVYATSELFVVPSSFEPCGLTQLSSQRYGAVPVVRGVGGLKDTVQDEQEALTANGFKFCERQDDPRTWNYAAEVPAAADLLVRTLLRALEVRRNPDRWEQIVANGLQRDTSWTIPAAQYRRLYDAAVRRHGELMFSRPLTLRQIEQNQFEFGQWFERLLTLPAPVFENLCKFHWGHFGPFDLSVEFRAELVTLREWGLIGGTALEQLPVRGLNLSDHLQITQAGLNFIRLRRGLKDLVEAK